jgi:hypothetical protein
MLKSWDTPGSVVYKLFATRPGDEVLSGLLPWLARGSQFTPGTDEVAAALLFRHRVQLFEPLCEALFRQDPWTRLGIRLLTTLFERDPERGVTLLERWTDGSVPSRDTLLDTLLLQLSSAILSMGVHDLDSRLEAVLDRIDDRTPPGSSNFLYLVEASALCPGRREAAWVALERLPDGWPMVEVAWLGRYADERPDAVLAVVDRCLESGDTKLRRDVLELCRGFGHRPYLLAESLHRIAGLIETQDKQLAFKIGQVIEDLLYSVPADSPARTSLVDLAQVAIARGNPEIQRLLAYYTTSRWKDGRPDSEDARRLWDTFVTNKLGSEALQVIISAVVEKCRTFTEVLASLDPLRAKLPADDFERAVIWQVGRRRDRRYFRKWADQPGSRLDADRFRLLRKLLLDGVRTDYAVRQAADLE